MHAEEDIILDPKKYKDMPYYKFGTHFVDNKNNLKNIMELVAGVSNDPESKINEELFLLLSFFILTYEYRCDAIQSILYKNRENFYAIIGDFIQTVEEEKTEQLLTALESKLYNIEYAGKIPDSGLLKHWETTLANIAVL